MHVENARLKNQTWARICYSFFFLKKNIITFEDHVPKPPPPPQLASFFLATRFPDSNRIRKHTTRSSHCRTLPPPPLYSWPHKPSALFKFPPKIHRKGFLHVPYRRFSKILPPQFLLPTFSTKVCVLLKILLSFSPFLLGNQNGLLLWLT